MGLGCNEAARWPMCGKKSPRRQYDNRGSPTTYLLTVGLKSKKMMPSKTVEVKGHKSRG